MGIACSADSDTEEEGVAEEGAGWCGLLCLGVSSDEVLLFVLDIHQLFSLSTRKVVNL